MIKPSSSSKSAAIVSRAALKCPLLDPFQLENPDVAEGTRTAIVEHPGSGLFKLPEAIGDKGLLRRLEELLDLPAA